MPSEKNLKSIFTDIADKIREKLKTTDTIHTWDMADKVGEISGSVDITKPIYIEEKTPIPNTGYVDKIYFNTSLTTNEVDTLIKDADLTFINAESNMYIYPILATSSKLIVILDYSSAIGAERGLYWIIGDLVGNTSFYVSPTLASAIGIPQSGWENVFSSFEKGDFDIQDNVLEQSQGLSIGLQNYLLVDLIRIYSKVDTGEVEILKTLEGQYKLTESEIILDPKDTIHYEYNFIDNINDTTKEINIIKNIQINPSQEDAIVTRTISTYTNDRVYKVGYYAFANCSSLESVSFPNATRINDYAFSRCNALTNVDVPLVDTIDDYAFYDCSLLEYITMPKVTTIYSNAFASDVVLEKVNLPQLTYIGTQAFSRCVILIKLFISQKDSVCKLSNINAFEYCYHILGTTNSAYNPTGAKDGYIYVPASLLSQYKVATNWVTYASQIVGHEDLEAGASLPDYTTSSLTTQTWYSDEELTNVVTEVSEAGTYYCRLEA